MNFCEHLANSNKTLSEYLQDIDPWTDVIQFAKGKTLTEFWRTCQRGDWMMLFARYWPVSITQEICIECCNEVEKLISPEDYTANFWLKAARQRLDYTVAEMLMNLVPIFHRDSVSAMIANVIRKWVPVP